ncbi:probable G-protein coupled receptor 139 [Narcine bancroftii]|uniref:probable G-protein coupled receptor 139 n=1 Tax=Narcine bancroftii TaxID=1343680 RepID=UPI003831C5F0
MEFNSEGLPRTPPPKMIRRQNDLIQCGKVDDTFFVFIFHCGITLFNGFIVWNTLIIYWFWRVWEGGREVNLMAILILWRRNCGLSRCITRYLVGMAMADLMCVAIGVLLEQVNYIYIFAPYLLFTPICTLTLVLRFVAMDCSVWLTVAFTFDRYVAIRGVRLRERYCTERTATVVMVIVTIWGCVRYVPYALVIKPWVVIDHLPWRCVPKAEYSSSTFWRIYTVFISVTTPLVPIGLIVLFNGLTVRHIVAANEIRRILRKNIVKETDPEAGKRRKSMVLLFSLSANFILLWIPYVVFNSKWQTQNYFYTDRYLNNPTYILQQCAYMLQFLSTCTNTCIYTLSQRRFREELKIAVKYLFT